MAESSEVAKIKEYKGLLDEGIISQEEFEEKSRPLWLMVTKKGIPSAQSLMRCQLRQEN